MKSLFMTALVAVLVTGCVTSLHPLYSKDTLMDASPVVGDWTDSDGDLWEFSATDGQGLNLRYTDDGKAGMFDAHFLKIDDQMFMDLFPQEPETDLNELYAMQMVPTHLFFLVKRIEPTLEIAVIDTDWVENYLEDNPGALGHEVIDQRLVLTAKTSELQAFLMAHHGDAFEDAMVMTRNP